MSKRELWEIVRADELNVGDVINRHGDPALSETVLETKCIPGNVLIQTDAVFAKLGLHSKLFRRISNADDPRVKDRAMEIIVCTFIGVSELSGADYSVIASAIDQARRELESEGSDDQA